jgi:hypothetical protein
MTGLMLGGKYLSNIFLFFMNRWLVSWIVRSGKTKALVKDMITLYRISTRYDNREGQNCYRIKDKR